MVFHPRFEEVLLSRRRADARAAGPRQPRRGDPLLDRRPTSSSRSPATRRRSRRDVEQVRAISTMSSGTAALSQPRGEWRANRAASATVAHRAADAATRVPARTAARQAPRADQRLLQIVELDAQHTLAARRSIGASGSASCIARIRNASCGAWHQSSISANSCSSAAAWTIAASGRCGGPRRQARSGRRDARGAARVARRPAPRRGQARRSSTASGAAKARKNGGMPIITSAAITVSAPVTTLRPRCSPRGRAP